MCGIIAYVGPRDSTGLLMAGLKRLAPVRTLERGYAIAFRADGSILRSTADVVGGDAIGVMLGDGEIAATVN